MKRWLKFISPWAIVGLLVPLLWTIIWQLVDGHSSILFYFQYITSPLSLMPLGAYESFGIVKITALLMISNAVVYIIVGTLFFEIRKFIITFIRKEKKING